MRIHFSGATRLDLSNLGQDGMNAFYSDLRDAAQGKTTLTFHRRMERGDDHGGGWSDEPPRAAETGDELSFFLLTSPQDKFTATDARIKEIADAHGVPIDQFERK